MRSACAISTGGFMLDFLLLNGQPTWIAATLDRHGIRLCGEVKKWEAVGQRPRAEVRIVRPLSQASCE